MKYQTPEFLQIDEIPLTTSGKLRKRGIVDRLVNGRARSTAIGAGRR